MTHSTEATNRHIPASKLGFIIFTIVIALILNLIPYTGLWLFIRPEFLAITLMYWILYQSERIGILSVLLCGLLMDVGTGDLFGQHAFAYLFAMFPVIVLRRRLITYTFWQQLIYLIPALFIMHSCLLLTKLIMGYEWVGWAYFLPLGLEFFTIPVVWWICKFPENKQTQQHQF